MEKRINIAKLLKDCPQGMELDCAMWDDVKFDEVEEVRGSYPICIKVGEEYEHLTEFGHWDMTEHGKCVIFPKGKTTWEGFVPPCKFKDGDIITCTKCGYSFVAIFKNQTKDCIFHSYARCTLEDKPFVKIEESASPFINPRPATEEESEALFKAIKDNGYKWNAETKALEKLIEPKFKVGDRIFNVLRKKMGASGVQGVISEITNDKYILTDGSYMLISNQDNWELVPNKFDLSTLVPFESKVLVRDYADEKWCPAIWGFYDYDEDEEIHYTVVSGKSYMFCIPYESNEHLLGTTDDCDDFYETWFEGEKYD